MVELREKVEGDRGTLKKIQTHIPGFAGYRRKEDIRAADSLLRLQMADKLASIRKYVEDGRTVLADTYNAQNLTKVGELIMKFKAVEGDVRHAEQGYSGISPAIRIEERQLDLLYEYDYTMITYALNMEKTVTTFKDLFKGNDNAAITETLERIGSWLDTFRENFAKRMKVITGTEVA